MDKKKWINQMNQKDQLQKSDCEMLREGRIELDKNEIESIYNKLQERQKQVQEAEGKQFQATQIPYSLVQTQIFPRDFLPFCLNQDTKQSSMKLYPINKQHLDTQSLSEKIKVLYEVINTFKDPKQRQKISIIFRLQQICNLVNCINQSEQLEQDKLYMPFIEEGKTLQKVQLWRFKHQEDQKSYIPYNERVKIFKDFQLILKILDKLTKNIHFQHFLLSPQKLLVLHYPKFGIGSNQYALKLQSQNLFKFLLHKNQTFTIKEPEKIKGARQILRKILSISQLQPQRSKLDQSHFEKTQYLFNYQDFLKLTYQDFYITKKPNLDSETLSQASSHQEQLEKLKEQIKSFEDLAKNQFKDFKLQNPVPKLTQTTKENNKAFWSTIEKYILSNVTESQRSAILTASQQKVTFEAKKPEKKPSSTNVKKQTKPEPKQVSKIETKPQDKQVHSKNAPKELVVVQKFLASASDLKFRSQLLIEKIQNKKSILYILKCKGKTASQFVHLACFINAKPQKQNFNLFGSYSQDEEKKSFIFSEKTQKFYKILDKNSAVGYGPQVFFSIGKLDIIVPCFGTEVIDDKEMLKCVSYFPLSYSSKGVDINEMERLQEESKENQGNQGKQSDIGLQRQFFLEDVDIYEIKVKGQ